MLLLACLLTVSAPCFRRVATLSAPGLLPAAGLLVDPAAPTKPASPSASSTPSPPVPIAGYSADKPGSQPRAAGNDKQDTLEAVLICSLVGGLVLAIVVVVAIRRASKKAKVEFEMARVKAEVARVYDEAYSGARGAAVVGINRLETTLGVDLDGDGAPRTVHLWRRNRCAGTSWWAGAERGRLAQVTLVLSTRLRTSRSSRGSSRRRERRARACLGCRRAEPPPMGRGRGPEQRGACGGV